MVCGRGDASPFLPTLPLAPVPFHCSSHFMFCAAADVSYKECPAGEVFLHLSLFLFYLTLLLFPAIFLMNVVLSDLIIAASKIPTLSENESTFQPLTYSGDSLIGDGLTEVQRQGSCGVQQLIWMSVSSLQAMLPLNWDDQSFMFVFTFHL